MNLERAREAGIEVTLPNLGAPSSPTASSSAKVGSPDTDALESRWILSRLHAVSAEVHRALSDYRFDEAASAIYQFFWGDLCDWYLEIVKLRLNFEPTNDLPFPISEDAERSVDQTRAALTTLVAVFESALRLLSPFMPFLTEEVWHALYAGLPPAKSIALTRYPQPQDYKCDEAALGEMQTLQELISTIRALRKELPSPETMRVVPPTSTSPSSMSARSTCPPSASASLKTLPSMKKVLPPRNANSATSPSWPKPPPTSSKVCASKPPKPAPSTTRPRPHLMRYMHSKRAMIAAHSLEP
jgi:valyl-tRNA synthetase